MKKITPDILSVFACVFALGMTLGAMIVRPTGEIHASVITVLGLCLTYSATLLGFELKK